MTSDVDTAMAKLQDRKENPKNAGQNTSFMLVLF